MRADLLLKDQFLNNLDSQIPQQYGICKIPKIKISRYFRTKILEHTHVTFYQLIYQSQMSSPRYLMQRC